MQSILNSLRNKRIVFVQLFDKYCDESVLFQILLNKSALTLIFFDAFNIG